MKSSQSPLSKVLLGLGLGLRVRIREELQVLNSEALSGLVTADIGHTL